MSFLGKNSGRAHVRLVVMGASALAVAAGMAGCGSEYRPVVTPINPSGPSSSPTALVAAVTYTGVSNPGVATIIDYSGDTVAAKAMIGPGPLTFTIDQTGTTGYTLHSDGTLATFPIASSLQDKSVGYGTLPTNADPVNILSPASGLWIADLNPTTGMTGIDYFSGSSPVYKQTIPVARVPVAVVSTGLVGAHNYSLSQNFATVTGNEVLCNTNPAHTLTTKGEVDSIDVATNSVSAKIPVGVCPVFGIVGSDSKRLFVLNRGSDTISVINMETNSLNNNCLKKDYPDGCTNQDGQTYWSHDTLPLSISAGLTGVNVPQFAGPVSADYNAATEQIVVANYEGDTVSVIDVGLDKYGNDGPTFGTTYTIPTGKNPASVTVLYDGSRAYTANQDDDLTKSGNGSVTVVNLVSHSVEKTLTVVGHPRTVASIQNSTKGKVYVASPDSDYLTIIRTDQDIVDTTMLLEGEVVDVRVGSQNAGSANTVVTSNRPGFGVPCYLPPSLEPPSTKTKTALEICREMP